MATLLADHGQGIFQRERIPEQRNEQGLQSASIDEQALLKDGDGLFGSVAKQVLWKYFSEFGLTAILAYSDRRALDMLRSFESYRMAVDKLTGFTNALSTAVTIWDSLPAPVRTGVLFITGKVMYALPSSAFSYFEGLLVDADRSVKNTMVVQAVDKLKWFIKAANNPISSIWQVGKGLYNSWWSTAEEGDEPKAESAGATADQADDKASLAKIDLRIIWVEVKGFKLAKTTEEGEQQREGGLQADFAFGMRMFGVQKSLGEDGRLTLIFPWSGGAIMELDETINILDNVAVPKLFEVQKLEMTFLRATNEGVDHARFALGKFGVFSDTIALSGMKASYDRREGMTFAGQATINLFRWAATGQLSLELDRDGTFMHGALKNFKESTGTVTVGEASFDKGKGFLLRDAAINFNKAIGFDLTGFINELVINNDQVVGEGGFKANQAIKLAGDHVTLNDVKGTVKADGKHAVIDAEATPKIDFKHVDATGKFHIGYDTEAGEPIIELSGGEFRVAYDTFSISAKGITYDHKKRQFGMEKADLLLPSVDVQGSISNVVIGKDGVQFTNASVVGPEQLKIIEGLMLNGTRFDVEKAGDGYTITAQASVVVDVQHPEVSANAENIRVTFAENDLSASVESLQLRTSVFSVDVKNATVGNAGFSVAEAGLRLHLNGDRTAEADAGKLISGFNSGIFDFLPVSGIGFTVYDVGFSSEGFRIGKFEPDIPPLSFNALGISGSVDFKQLEAALKGEKTFSLADFAGALPLSVSIAYPVVPGLEVYGSAGAEASLGLALGVAAKGKDGVWGVTGGVGIHGRVALRLELGVQAGSQALIALSAGAFAEGSATADAQADISGAARWDRERKSFAKEAPLMARYKIEAEAKAAVGIVIKAKALYFFEKKLYEFTAAEWVLGHYRMDGQLGEKSLEDDKLVSSMAEKPMLDTSSATKVPIVTKEGQDVDVMLRSDRYIYGSGDERRALLSEERAIKAARLREMEEQRVKADQRFEKLRKQYITTMDKKLAYFMRPENLEAPDINERMAAFNKASKLDKLWEKLEQCGATLDEVETGIDRVSRALETLVALNPDKLQEGIADEVQLLDDQEEALSSLKMPDLDTLETMVSEADAAVPDVSPTPTARETPLMSLERFITATTTKSRFLGQETKRKKITLIDQALERYHERPDDERLAALEQAIDGYLANSKSERVPFVIVLRRQVKDKRKKRNT